MNIKSVDLILDTVYHDSNLQSLSLTGLDLSDKCMKDLLKYLGRHRLQCLKLKQVRFKQKHYTGMLKSLEEQNKLYSLTLSELPLLLNKKIDLFEKKPSDSQEFVNEEDLIKQR